MNSNLALDLGFYLAGEHGNTEYLIQKVKPVLEKYNATYITGWLKT